ncbi:MAG: hypothetical protein SNJ69_10110 [Chloroflexaceae bacterium]
MDTPSDLLFVVVGTAVITAFIIAAVLQSITPHRTAEVIHVLPLHPSEDSGSGCLFILLIGFLLAILILLAG